MSDLQCCGPSILTTGPSPEAGLHFIGFYSTPLYSLTSNKHISHLTSTMTNHPHATDDIPLWHGDSSSTAKASALTPPKSIHKTSRVHWASNRKFISMCDVSRTAEQHRQFTAQRLLKALVGATLSADSGHHQPSSSKLNVILVILRFLTQNQSFHTKV